MTQLIEVNDGLLAWEGTDLRLNFRIKVDRLGDVAVEFDPIRSSDIESFWSTHWPLWHKLERSKNRRIPHFHLSGYTADGVKILTEYARLESLGQSSTPHEVVLQPRGVAAELNLEYPLPEVAKDKKISAIYLSRGQLGFTHPPVETPLGLLSTEATANVEESTDSFGVVRILKSGDLSLEEWVESCDDLAERVLNILSLAQGRWLQWTAREVTAGDDWISRRIRPRELRDTALAQLFHHLNLEPVLKLAVQSYTRDLIRQTGLDIALSWMLAPAPYVEGGFLNQMIALELLVSAFETKTKGLISKDAFRSMVKPRLCQAIDGLVEDGILLTEGQGNIFRAKINDLNSPVFYDKVRQLLTHYDVPIHDLEASLKFAVVDCRNDLVHRGLLHKIGDDSDRIHQNSDLAEELLKRIVMAMLGYRGQYISALYNLESYVFDKGRVGPLNRHNVEAPPDSGTAAAP